MFGWAVFGFSREAGAVCRRGGRAEWRGELVESELWLAGGDFVLNSGRSDRPGGGGRGTGFENLLPGDANGLGCFDGKSDPTTADFGDRDSDVTSDVDGFANFSAEHQHWAPVACGSFCSRWMNSAEIADLQKITHELKEDSRRNAEDSHEIREIPDPVSRVAAAFEGESGVDLRALNPARFADSHAIQKSRFRIFGFVFPESFKLRLGGFKRLMGSNRAEFRGGFPAAFMLMMVVVASVRAGDERVGKWTVEEQRGVAVLYSEFSISAADVWRELEDVSSLLEQSVGIAPTDGRVEIILFESQSSYLRYLLPGLPQARSRRALFYRNADVSQIYAWNNRALITDLRHEMVHVRVHQHLPFAPLWLDEGLAECFEERMGSRGDAARRELLRWKARMSQLSSLRVLERLPSAESMDGNDYRNSWAWTAFLLEESEESRRLLRAYVQEIHRGEAPGAFSSYADTQSPLLLTRANSYFRKMRSPVSFDPSSK